jgi:hypothetical protein
MHSQTGIYSRQIRTVDSRHSQHDNTTSINLQRSLLFKNTNQKQTERVQSTQLFRLFRLIAQWQKSSMLENPINRRTRNSSQINTSDWDIHLRRPRLLQKQKMKKNIIMERAQDSISSCSRDQLAEKASVRRRQSQTTRNAFTISARETSSQKLATRSLVMTKINNHKMRAEQ